MDESESDRLRLFAAQRILAERDAVPGVIGEMARQFPEVSGLAICYVITELAVESVRTWSPRDAAEAALPGALYQAAALLAADLFALQHTGTPDATGKDLLGYWGAGDGFFLS